MGIGATGHQPVSSGEQRVGQRVQPGVGVRVAFERAIVGNFHAAQHHVIARRERVHVEAGADVIFAEAITTLEEYKRFSKAVTVPLLANITEFGKTPLFTVDELRGAGIGLIIYPLSAFRAMSQAALAVYETLRREGTQQAVVDKMQTREELYDVLRYHDYERKLDQLFAKGDDNS